MILNFRQYIEEQNNTLHVAFGDFNPPSIDDGVMFDELSKMANNGGYRVFASNLVDNVQNPLEYKYKIKTMRKMFPKHSRNIVMNHEVECIADVAKVLIGEGNNSLVFVVRDENLDLYKKRIRESFPEQNIGLVSFGSNQTNLEQIKNAKKPNFSSFSNNVTNHLSNEDTKNLFNQTRKGLSLKESNKFLQHIKLEPISNTREDFVKGGLFFVGDTVVINETNEEVSVVRIGTNYVTVEDKNGNKLNKWPTDVTPNIKESPATGRFRKIMDKKLDDKLKKASKEIKAVINPTDSDYKKISKKHNIKDYKTLQGYMATKGWK